MNLRALVDKKNIILNLNVESKKRLIEFLVNRLVDSCLDVDEDLVLSNIYQRERIGSTYVGDSIYIPRCRVENLGTTKLIVAKLKSSYYDDSIGEHIKIATAVFFPQNISKTHIDLLKQLTLFLKDKQTRKYFELADSAEDLYNLIVRR